jgi:16S rRNA (guanine966-N2)-methyltransferase
VPDLTVIEKDNQMFAFIKKTAADLNLQNFNAVKSDVFRYIENCHEQYDLIFAGPPYALQNIDDLPRLVFEKKLLKENGWFILEHTPRNDYTTFPFFKMARNYGTTIFSFFVNQFATTE